MKAFLLAAGLGARLRPLTLSTPKCLVPVNGKPLLQWWIELFRQHGITEVLINTYYLRGKVAEFIAENNSGNSGVTLYEAREDRLTGSGGMVRNNRHFVDGEESFMIAYADNLTDTDLSEFQSFHRNVCLPNNGVLSMALFRTNLPEQCGIAELDSTRRITAFTEKPEHPASNLANAGIYIAGQELFSFLPECEILDFGKDILPLLVNRMYGWEDSNYLIDIGTPENYAKAQAEWRVLHHDNH